MSAEDNEYWTQVITEARKHARGVEGYLEEHEVGRPSYYNWFKKLKPLHPEWKIPLKTAGRRLKRKRKKQLFVPIKIQSEQSVGFRRAIEIRLAAGHTIAFPNGVDDKYLVAIVKALGNGKC